MIAYRDATLADGAELNAMARAGFIETFGDEYEAADLEEYVGRAYGPEGLMRDLADPAIPFRLALADAGIIGFAKRSALTLPAPDPAPGAAELRQLYVRRAWHGSGVAQALMDWTIAGARDAGASELYLAVFEFNRRARAFYARQGFVDVGACDFRVGGRVDRDRIWRLAL